MAFGADGARCRRRRQGGLRREPWHDRSPRNSPCLRPRSRKSERIMRSRKFTTDLERRRRLRAARPVRLRQDHPAQHHFRPGDARRKAGSCSTARCDAAVDPGAQHRSSVPVSGHLRHHDRVRQSRLSAAQSWGGRGRRDRARQRNPGDDRTCTTLLKRKARGLTADTSRRSRWAVGWCGPMSMPSCSTSR